MLESPDQERSKLAIFDFDGTLTAKDTMLEFIRFVHGPGRLYRSLVLLSPWLVLERLGLYPSELAKKRLLRYHFKGMEKAVMIAKGELFCADELPRLFRDEALERLHFHRSKGHRVLVVTASLDIWVAPWLETQGIEGLCTRTDWSTGSFNGQFIGANNNGPEKARRIKEYIDLAQFDRVYAYGDSSGDKEMMALAHRRFFRKFA